MTTCLDAMDLILIQTLNGLASASSLFLVASGLSIIFGVTRVVNFAHGSFYMLGAYIAWSLVTRFGPANVLGFWGGVVLAALLVGVIGVLIEIVLLRRIYQAPELFQLLATFGVVLMVQDVALASLGSAGPARTARAGLPQLRHHLRQPLSNLRAVPDRARAHRAGRAVAAVQPDALGHAGAGGDARPRDGGRAGRQPAPAVHLGVLPGLVPRRSRRRAAAAARGREPAHGPVDHRRSLRGGGGRRARQRHGRLSGGGAHRRHARVRHPDLSQDHAGAGVPDHGGGADRAAARPDGPQDAAWARTVRRPASRCCRPPTREIKIIGAAALAIAGGGTAAARQLRRQPADRAGDPDAVRRQPAFHDGAGRTRLVRPCRLFRSRRLRRGAGRQMARRTHGGGAAVRAVSGRPGGRRVRLVLRAAVGRVPGDAHAGLRADRLVGGVPVGGADRRRQRHPGRVAVGVGVGKDRLLLSRPGPVHGGRARACARSSSRRSDTPCARAATVRCGRRPSAST